MIGRNSAGHDTGERDLHSLVCEASRFLSDPQYGSSHAPILSGPQPLLAASIQAYRRSHQHTTEPSTAFRSRFCCTAGWCTLLAASKLAGACRRSLCSFSLDGLFSLPTHGVRFLEHKLLGPALQIHFGEYLGVVRLRVSAKFGCADLLSLIDEFDRRLAN